MNKKIEKENTEKVIKIIENEINSNFIENILHHSKMNPESATTESHWHITMFVVLKDFEIKIEFIPKLFFNRYFTITIRGWHESQHQLKWKGRNIIDTSWNTKNKRIEEIFTQYWNIRDTEIKKSDEIYKHRGKEMEEKLLQKFFKKYE